MKRHGKQVVLAGGLAGLFLAAAFPTAVRADAWSPEAYAAGASAEGLGYSVASSYTEVGDDIYVTFAPTFEVPFWKFRIGLQVPIEVLVLDREPKGEEDVPSVRLGTYDEPSDYLKLVQYIRAGKHLYYDPDDAFNWSVFYGNMSDGWMGHKTIVYRYDNNYDPTIFRAGLMADINNNWGGVEHFSSDIWRKEAVGWRGYIRPWGIVAGVHDLLYTHNGRMMPRRMVAASIRESRNPDINGGYYFQERIPAGRGGRLGQQFHGKIGEHMGETGTVRFVEMEDPETGVTQIRAVEGDEQAAEDEEERADEWQPSFWNRFAIGYFVIQDVDAPLELETDGSGNLVFDPETGRPRSSEEETLIIEGWDVEFRMSPFEWFDLTPYADFPIIRSLENSKAIHLGIDNGFDLGGVTLTFRPEYREVSSNYLTTYFDQYHIIERTIYNPGGDGDSSTGAGSSSTTKLSYLQSLPADGETLKGYFVQFVLDWLDSLVIDATYEDLDGDDNSKIFVGIYVPALLDIYFNGYYTKTNYNDIKKSFIYDDRSLAAAELGYIMFGGLTLSVTFQRTWVFDDTENSYVPVDEIGYGIGWNASF